VFIESKREGEIHVGVEGEREAARAPHTRDTNNNHKINTKLQKCKYDINNGRVRFSVPKVKSALSQVVVNKLLHGVAHLLRKCGVDVKRSLKKTFLESHRVCSN
jgi:hypothetical protein